MYMLWPVVFIPLLHGDEVPVSIAGGAGRGIQGRVENWRGCEVARWGGGFKEGGHGIVDLQDEALGAVFAIFLFVFAFDNGEGMHDVFHSVAGSGKVSGE